jgi:hypothetical protein
VLNDHPTARKIDELVRDLADPSARGTIKPAEMPAYVAYLNFVLLDQLSNSKHSDETKAAYMALDAEAVGAQLRAPGGSKSDIPAMRSKIDAVAQQKGGNRFLPALEERFALILKGYYGPGALEKHLEKLASHSDPKVVEMAQRLGAQMDAQSKPLELTFTALDGKEVDIAQLRGKLLLLWFITSTHKNIQKEIDDLDFVASDFKKNVNVVVVSLDKDSDRNKLEKLIKDKKVKWPVYFAGGRDSDLAKKLGVTATPAAVLLDQNGMVLKAGGVKTNQVEPMLKQVLTPPKDKKK